MNADPIFYICLKLGKLSETARGAMSKILAKAGLCRLLSAIAPRGVLILKEGPLSLANDSASKGEIPIGVGETLRSRPAANIQSISPGNREPACSIVTQPITQSSSSPSHAEFSEFGPNSALPQPERRRPCRIAASTGLVPCSDPIAGIVSCPERDGLQNGAIVFEYPGPFRLPLTSDVPAWEARLAVCHGEGHRLIFGNKLRVQEKCESPGGCVVP